MPSINTNANANNCTIPLTVPYCDDPRYMKTQQIRKELKQRNICNTGKKNVLVARLLKVMVDEGLKNIPDPLLMDDMQPEKWMLIANQSSVLMNELEPDGKVRMNVMAEINTVLDKIKTSKDDLMSIATGNKNIHDFNVNISNSPLYNAVARFASALMIEPVIEAQLYDKYKDIIPKAHRVITSSRTIFNMTTGFMKIPSHLSISN